MIKSFFVFRNVTFLFLILQRFVVIGNHRTTKIGSSLGQNVIQ